MRRTTILADPELLTNLEEIARRDGLPTSHVIREAMERYVAARRGESGADLPAIVGMFEGAGDVAERDEEILREEMPAAADPNATEPAG
jgi:predicted transcriptional regulator